MSAAELIRDYAEERPLAVRLAEAVSLAVLIDRPLLRRARLTLVPEADPGTEADLWTSPLVQTRSPDGLVLIPEIAQELRKRLAADPDRLAAAWELTRYIHGHLSPALQVEEEIAWLSVSPSPQAAGRIEELLQSVVAALMAGERRGLAHWALRALPMLPSKVRSLETARILDAGAKLRLGGDARPLQEGMPDDVSWITPVDLPRVPVRVRLFDGAVELNAGATDGLQLQLPQTDPLLLHLIWEKEGREETRQITFRSGEEITEHVPVSSVSLRTLLGEVYDLRREGEVARGMRDWIIDFSEERARHRPYFKRPQDKEILTQLFASSDGQLILVRGETGSGKTALLCRMIDLLFDMTGRTPPHHLFRRWSPMEDVKAAERSLCAQIAAQFPQVEHAATYLHLPELLRHLSLRGIPEAGTPLVLVLDAIDEARGGEAGELLSALVESLPPKIVVLASIREKSFGMLPVLEMDVELTPSPLALDLYWNHYIPQVVAHIFDETIVRTIENFGIAEIVRSALGTSWLRLSSSSRLLSRTSTPRFSLESLWEEATERFGIEVVESWLGALTAARGSLPEFFLIEILGDQSYSRVIDSPFMRVRITEGEQEHELAEEVLREFIASRLDLKSHHSWLAEIATAALDNQEASEQLRGYALRNAVAHWLAAGDLAAAERLVLTTKYLTAKCRALGVSAARRDLRDCISAEVPNAQEWVIPVLEVLEDRGDVIEAEPEVLTSLLYTRLSQSWSPEEIQNTLQIPPDEPPLRLDPPVLGPWTSDPGRRHRGAVVGCLLLDNAGVLSWSTDGTLKLWDDLFGDLKATLTGHHAAVTSCARLDGDRWVTGSRDGTLRLWHLSESASYRTLLGHEGEVLGVLGLMDGTVISWSADRTIRVWNLDHEEEVLILRGHEDTVTACTLIEQGKYLVSGSKDGTIRVWDMESGRLITTRKAHGAAVTSVTCRLLDDSPVASCSLDRKVLLWASLNDVEAEGVMPQVLEGHQLGVVGCSFSPAGRRFASWSYDQTILVWSYHTYRDLDDQPVVLRGHTGAILSCAFFLDGDRLVSASADGTLRIWDVRSGETLHILEGHTGPVRAAALNAVYRGDRQGVRVEQIVSASDDRTLRIWNAESGEEIAVLDDDDKTLRLLSLQDRPRALGWSREKGLQIFNLDRAADPTVIRFPPMVIEGGAALPDDRLVVLWSGGLLGGRSSIFRVDLDGKNFEAFSGPDSPILAGAVTPDGRRLLVGCKDGSLRFWDLVERQPLETIQAHTGPVSDIQMSPDGQWALSASWDRTLRILDFRTMNSLEVFKAHKDRVLACAMYWEGRVAVTASADRTLYLWNLEEGQGRHLTGHDDQVTGCSFTRDGTRIVSRSHDGTLGIWDTRTGQLVHRLRAHKDWVNDFVIDDARGVLYSCSEDRTVRAWDIESGEPRGVVYGVSPFRSLALTDVGVAAGDEAGNFWALELGARFDVFLSCVGSDEPFALDLAEALKVRGLKAWLYGREVASARPVAKILEEALSDVRSVAVLVGESGIGTWQEREIELFMLRRRNRPIIPVLLPGASIDPDVSQLLETLTWLDLREGLTEDGLDRLQWGITGRKPRQSSESMIIEEDYQA